MTGTYSVPTLSPVSRRDGTYPQHHNHPRGTGPGAMCDTLSAGPSGSCTGWGLTQLSSPHHKRSTDPQRYCRALHADIYRRRTASSRALDDYGLLRRPAQSHLAKLFEVYSQRRPFVRDELCGCAARNDDPGAAHGFGPSRLTANRAGARTPRARAQLLLSQGFADTPSFRRRFIFAGGGACLYDQVTVLE